MTTVRDIMQIGVGMPDPERFANFARDMLGLPATTSPDGKITYVRPDRYRHRIAARTAPAKSSGGSDTLVSSTR